MIYILFFILLTYYILTHSDVSLYYALYGLTLWYSKMVPSLLPFMILSGILIRMHLTERFVVLFHPILKRIFRCNPNVTYGILMGFLCGFPMGAKAATDLLRQGKISEGEARFLLAFCNNIGPVYFCSFVIPTLNITNIPLALAGMYGIPMIYGILLRNTLYNKELNQCLKKYVKYSYSSKPEAESMKFPEYRKIFRICRHQNPDNKQAVDLLTALDESIRAGISSISMLCGYMISFNLLNLLPHFFLPSVQKYLAPVLEITGGISLNRYDSPLYILILLPFGGLSCIAQTNSIIRGTSLSIKAYTLHKLVLTLFTGLFYIVLFQIV